MQLIITNQIKKSVDNTSLMMAGEFNFNPKTMLNKRLIFDRTIVDKETIMDKIIEGLNDTYLDNDKYWIEHEPRSNYFTLRLEDGR